MSIWECRTAAVSVIEHAVYARAHDVGAAVTVRNRRIDASGCQTIPGSSASTVTARRHEQDIPPGAPAAQTERRARAISDRPERPRLGDLERRRTLDEPWRPGSLAQ